MCFRPQKLKRTDGQRRIFWLPLLKNEHVFSIFLSQMKIIIVSFRQSICDICINESQSYPSTKCSNQSYIVLIVIVSLKHLLLAGNEWFNSEISRDVDLILFSRIFSTDEIERNTNDSLEMIVSDWRPFIKEIFQFPEDSPIYLYFSKYQ